MTQNEERRTTNNVHVRSRNRPRHVLDHSLHHFTRLFSLPRISHYETREHRLIPVHINGLAFGPF